MNYTEEQTAKLVEEYKAEPSMITVAELAIAYGKSPKSIIGKLSREGVYERSVYKNKSGNVPITKAEICSNIAENLGLEIEHLVGLEKAPKSTLKWLEQATGAKQTEQE